jgi:hypothetical protein
MSRALAHRLRRLEERWALQTARRILRLPPLMCLACYLDCAPEALPAPEDIADALLPELEHLIAHARRQTPRERTRALAQSLLTEPDCPINQRLLGALARYEGHSPEA